MKWTMALAMLALASIAGAQTVYDTSFEATGDPSGVSFPTGALTAGGWTTDGTATVSNAAGGAASGTQFVVQDANSSIRRTLTPPSAPTQVLMRGFYKGTGDTELVLPSGSQPYAAVVGFRNIDANTLTIAGYNGQTSTWSENAEFTMATGEWHRIVVYLNYAAGARNYSVSVNDTPVLQNVPFHTSALSTLNGFESSSGAGASVDTIGFFLSDGDHDNDGVTDAAEVAQAGADPFDPYKPNPNAAPTAIALNPSSVAENVASGATVGTLTATDSNPSDSSTFTLVSGTGSTDNASFTISGTSLQTAASFNFEAKSSYSVRVRATDPGGLSFEQALTVTINNVNEAPSGPTLANASVAENLAAGAVVGALQSTDPDASDTATYTLVSGTGSTDNAAFTISGGNLVTAQSFNFEAKSSYAVRVRVTDGGALFSEAALTVNVTNENDAPGSLELEGDSVAENADFGTVVGTLSAIDPDAGDELTFELVAGAGSTDNASFSIEGNSLQTAAIFDFETKSSYSVRVRAFDGTNASVEAVFNISVTNVNEVPTLVALTVPAPVPETATVGTVVGTLATTDPDAASTFVYTLVAGVGDDHNTSFTINGSQLRVAAALDFESTPFASVRVRTTDGGSLFLEEIFSIELADVVEANPVLELAGNSIEENQPADTVVGTLSVSNAGSFTYDTFTVLDTLDGSSFTVDGNELRTTVSFNYEQLSSRLVSVQASGEGAPTVTQDFTISILNVNEAPVPVAIDAAFGAEENVPVGSTMAIIIPNPPAGDTFTTGFDPDGSEDAVTFSIDPDNSENNGVDFAISGSTIISTRSFNFEEQSSFVLTIIATDQEGLTSSSQVTINLTDMPDPPTSIALSNATVRVGQLSVGTFSTQDEDTEGTHSYALVAGDGDDANALFEIDGDGLVLTGPVAAGTYSIRVETIDDVDSALRFSDSFTITVRSTAAGWVIN